MSIRQTTIIQKVSVIIVHARFPCLGRQSIPETKHALADNKPALADQENNGDRQATEDGGSRKVTPGERVQLQVVPQANGQGQLVGTVEQH